MATVGFNGRELTITWGSTIIKGVQSKSANFTREAVEVTSDDDSGHQTFLAEPGKMGAEWQADGITGDETLIAAILTGSSFTLPTATLTLPTGGTVAYSFFLQSLELSGEHDGAYEFSATMVSSGAPTWTPDT